jgi:nicotinamidase-related amidase
MSSVIDLRAYLDPLDIPTLVMVDMQEDAIADPARLPALVSSALANCRAVLSHARAMGFPIAHVRRARARSVFEAGTHTAPWIEGFQPWGSEMIFERERPSCYASAQFTEVMTYSGGNIVLAGFAGQGSCLSTAVEAFHRGQTLTYLADASASHDLDELGASDVHRAVTKLIGLYATIGSTRPWIAATSRWRGLRNEDACDRTA